ncbi:class I SAM-dependent methyltransferase [Hyphomonas sp. WL0036]|uniref:class I SAM-dependent methyltransferase n=1 Tax=Hyphomonas sediminis TaxID=2866160 RepID=UPI001C81C3CA|nr:class I SAM-dependent methyltransferase [Hyphomonas sediminis]MBY9065541.1 class I SAM-dependent methyltransferase [Hyphomonas sediminis]
MNPWDRYVVPNLVSCACSSRPIMKQRAKVVPQAEGVVLEIGCGSGTNFKMYDAGKVEKLYALEPSPGMVVKARRTADELGIGKGIEFLETGAEKIPLADKSVDTAVITFVLCTIPDWKAALEETRRVLKPGGRVLFSEHGLAPDEGVAKWQRRVEPVWKALAGGCRLTRDTSAMLTEAGFALEGAETMYLPNTPKIAGFVSWGGARIA